jgi:hypothetical protein
MQCFSREGGGSQRFVAISDLKLLTSIPADKSFKDAVNDPFEILARKHGAITGYHLGDELATNEPALQLAAEIEPRSEV